MSEPGDDVPRDPWGNPLPPEDRPPANPRPDDFPPTFPSGPPAPPEPTPPPSWPAPRPGPPAPPPDDNPAWPGRSSEPAPPLPPPPGQPPYGQPPYGQAPYVGPPYGQQQGWGAPSQGWGQGPVWAPAKNDGMAIGALVCAIAGLLLCGIVVEPVAIVLGVISRRRIRESNGTLKGDGLAIAAIVLGIVGTVLAIVGLIILATNPDALHNLFSGLTTTTTAGG